MKENKIKNWIEEAEKGAASRIIVLRIENSNDIENFISLIHTTKIGYYKTLYRAIKVSSIFEGTQLEKGTNLILINDVNNYNPTITGELYYHFYLQRGIIYIEDKNSIDKFIYMLGNNTDFNNEIEYELIEKTDFETMMKDKINIIRNFFYRVDILKKIGIYILDKEIEFYQIVLTHYVKYNIISANLIHKLYQVANLDFGSSSRAIGDRISLICGVKSKSIHILNISLSLRRYVKNNNIKVYDLNFNQIEYDTKLKIAKELIKLASKNLTVERISKIVGLPLKDIDKLYK